ncbi:GAF sensor signal transduction histidine kinase [Cystobacter fuscus DSM 2262]|uniref:histidine kinase n=1 Tax=Cystobacter fuscus (strain ATCC 25194 / DSM 2262 / NBRC 100088 / M29) TaxID=1242864 RepID=S9NYX0_CYSF2|nr:HAMP domain-containing sensor histidine kinase [Cystobacter fuscus]EPX57420.1 GAF sensor signal transduction histidine kinase [Cystobacter fuscus DSM 2262]
MEPTDKKPRPEHENTDQSLRQERERTDDEFSKKRDSIGEDADAVVQRARAHADMSLKVARAKADERMEQSEAPQQERQSVASERAQEDVTLRQERATSDEKLQEERKARKRALANLLRLEREATDQHLLLERERSDEALAARDDFLAMVSHDLRTLLGGIAMRAAMLVKNASADEAGQRTRRDAESIQHFTARMNRLIGDLLDVASIEAGRLSVEPRPEDAIRLVRETVEVFQPSASARGISLDSEVARDSLLARFDHERILQVLANLLSNAIKFTPEGGRISIRVEPSEAEVRFSVMNTGPGIAEENLGRIFERFWQVLASDRRGMGLGLYISKCIVEAHGGRIWAESKPDAGSTFFFTLPGARTPG